MAALEARERVYAPGGLFNACVRAQGLRQCLRRQDDATPQEKNLDHGVDSPSGLCARPTYLSTQGQEMTLDFDQRDASMTALESPRSIPNDQP